MHRLDRALGILLLLRSGKAISATALAARFEVSTRTIYRDLDLLGALGVPLYAEQGRNGGYRLLPGYFLPPVMFTTGEATALLLGLTLLRALRGTPFAAELTAAEQKLVATLPDGLRGTLAHLPAIIGFEPIPADLLHPEWGADGDAPAPPAATVGESEAVTIFLQARFSDRAVTIGYYSPYRARAETWHALPAGLLWDRDRWYLVGYPRDEGAPAAGAQPRLWRADRVVRIAPDGPAPEERPRFAIGQLLGRGWLRAAMAQWRSTAPVVIRLTPAQAARLGDDWYYRHAVFAPQSDGTVLMTFGEADRRLVLDLLRWLGPGAVLLEPANWRAALLEELAAMLADHAERGDARQTMP